MMFINIHYKKNANLQLKFMTIKQLQPTFTTKIILVIYVKLHPTSNHKS